MEVRAWYESGDENGPWTVTPRKRKEKKRLQIVRKTDLRNYLKKAAKGPRDRKTQSGRPTRRGWLATVCVKRGVEIGIEGLTWIVPSQPSPLRETSIWIGESEAVSRRTDKDAKVRTKNNSSLLSRSWWRESFRREPLGRQ